jgi:hypothetical protein
MTISIGVIAEDSSDSSVVQILIRKYRRPRPSKCIPINARGAGRIRSKCNSWAKNLRERGCTRLILIRDSDQNNPQQLYDDLSAALAPSPIALHVIVIPVREIEAWLLADHAAIRNAMKIRGGTKRVANPEALARPKEHLRDCIYKWSGKTIRYVNTIDNTKIAAAASVNELKRCPSFRVFDSFVTTHC